MLPGPRSNQRSNQLHDKSRGGYVGSHLQRCTTIPLRRPLCHGASTIHKLLKTWCLASSLPWGWYVFFPPGNWASTLLRYSNNSIPHLWPQGADLIRPLKGGGKRAWMYIEQLRQHGSRFVASVTRSEMIDRVMIVPLKMVWMHGCR